MTERVSGFIVTLKQDFRIDDHHVQQLMRAIKLLQDVIAVEPVTEGVAVHIAEQRAKYEIRTKILEVLFPHILGGREK